MWARVATFEGDPGDIDERIERVRSVIESGSPLGLEDVRLLLLADRESGRTMGVALFDSEEAMREGDEIMNAGPGHAGGRSSVHFYEVPIHTL